MPKIEIYLRKVHASWGSPDSNQYHIQTDEGPERYFKYQTDNGQYRKEKRLQDGTVIGTDAWIDASGYLRQKDYIADNKGYRILKSKTVYVGRGLPIQDAIKSAKNRPADSGVLVDQQGPPSYSSGVSPTTTPRPIARPAVTPNSIKSVFIRPHSQPVRTNYHLPASIASDQYLPPSRHYVSSTPRPVEVYGDDISSTPIAVYAAVPSSTQAPFVLINNDPNDYHHHDHYHPVSNDLLPPKSEHTQYYRRRYSNARRPYGDPISVSSLAPFLEHVTQTPKSYVVPIASNDLDQQPLFNRDLLEPPPSGFGTRYQPIRRADHEYDGVSVTNDGFKYYLPRQYHEETNSGGSAREGSFGYIDPFGIRRVVYYNTGPGKGFVHRKNNRYVGFNATPYDPRPPQ
ncbi:uncharacterized protein LOC129755761 isoform X2 [Uranotaenia lowii]|uniref:uncharacterized protein LOC129755761 isoform X2 n=1 Tax=Uranotaenia lowii TaxID=190385 RepID=UPI00247A398C|nr:uncharacterized protein LOC129755761 isoform X2 [Uranotaenia lowii]